MIEYSEADRIALDGFACDYLNALPGSERYTNAVVVAAAIVDTYSDNTDFIRDVSEALDEPLDADDRLLIYNELGLW